MCPLKLKRKVGVTAPGSNGGGACRVLKEARSHRRPRCSDTTRLCSNNSVRDHDRTKSSKAFMSCPSATLRATTISRKSVVQKRRGRPPNPCINSVISLRLGADLELQVEQWRTLRPKPPSRSSGYSRITHKGIGSRTRARGRLFLIRRHKHTAQESDATSAVLEVGRPESLPPKC